MTSAQLTSVSGPFRYRRPPPPTWMVAAAIVAIMAVSFLGWLRDRSRAEPTGMQAPVVGART